MGAVTILSNLIGVVASKAVTPAFTSGPRSIPPISKAPLAKVTIPAAVRASRLAAWDCLFTDVDGHTCVDKFGDPFRAGGSCHASASLMSLRSFPHRYPHLYTQAVLAGIIEEGR